MLHLCSTPDLVAKIAELYVNGEITQASELLLADRRCAVSQSDSFARTTDIKSETGQDTIKEEIHTYAEMMTVLILGSDGTYIVDEHGVTSYTSAAQTLFDNWVTRLEDSVYELLMQFEYVTISCVRAAMVQSFGKIEREMFFNKQLQTKHAQTFLEQAPA